VSKDFNQSRSDDSDAQRPEKQRPEETQPNDQTAGLDQTKSIESPGLAAELHDFTDGAVHIAGNKLGKYQIQGLIGRGGMGLVWKGYDPDLQRTVAIKVLGPHLAHSATSRRRFQREGRAAAAVSHPNVVTVHSVEEHGQAPYLVMEYVSGGSLREHVKQCGKLPATEVIRLSYQIAQGLAAAHAQGVIHRDVKPGNVMLHEGASRAKLTDFGLARVVYDNADLSSHDQLIGTPAYTSPEQIRGPKVDARADLFSLGCVMFYMLTGQPPWQGYAQAETIHKIATDVPPRLHELDASIPRPLSDIVEKLLRKDPAERYQSAAEVADTLRRYLLQMNQSASDEVLEVLNRPPVESTKPSGRSPAVLRLGLVTLVLALLALTVWASRGWLGLGKPAEAGASAAGGPASPPLSKLSNIRVGPESDADCKTIAEAISRAAENCTILVSGPGPYAEAVKLQGAAIRGLKLQATRRAVWRTPPSANATCLSISDAADISVEGFDFEVHAESGRAITVGDAIDNVSIRDCAFRHMLPRHKLSLVLVGSRPGKTPEQMHLSRCKFYAAEGHIMCLSVGGLPQAETRVNCEDCEFSSPHTHIYVTQACHELRLAGNVFLAGDNAINLSFKPWSPDCRIEIVNNTFVGTRFWIGFMDSFRGGGESPAGPTACRVCNNLILGGERVLGAPDQWEPVLSAWKFAGNIWEADSTTKRQSNYGERVATFLDDVKVTERDDPLDPNFLVPAADSPLAALGVGGDLATYVGAKAPRPPHPDDSPLP
jgi:serine/threonine protein kinase